MTKKILLISQLILLLMFSCNYKEKRTDYNEINISGKVKDFNGQNAELYLIYSQPGTKRYNEPLKIDSAGNFKFKLKSKIPLDAFILDKKSFANINFIYHPEDSIYLEFSPNKNNLDLLKTVRFKGDRQETNNLLIDFQILREENNLGYGAIQESSYNKDVNSFILEMDSIKLKQSELINQFKSNNRLNAETESWITSFAYETYYYFLNDYGVGKKDLPSNYYDFNNDLSVMSASNMVSWRNLSERINSYSLNTVSPAIHNEFSGIMGDMIDGEMNADSLVIGYIRENTTNDLLAQLLISHHYTSQFNENVVDGYENNQDLITETIKLSSIKDNLNKYYEETSAFVNKPGVYTNEVLLKMNDTPIEETFSEILSKNEGKVIYLDVWATWCSPCIKAMPDSKKLMGKFKDKDVSFVYLCIESKEDLWKRLVSDFNLGGGQHYLMDKNQSKFFRETMDVQGIPQYFIIDKLGNIVERGNDIHPGNKITEEKILARLK
ncbi:TlpA disulfide reductase family protein [Aureibaculum sp. 2210JD6-5]|uniref:TlpA family protein disulfide reductase n=1 Tax=Aureibaculum sp. 2210JD6-5 TaxID=3103957 RepID=UPI002AADC1EC|nr:TlpA disulfide reductase family protein [Aureibaculum sp. 2210JD6-5]MDY7395282.1 TlpA disulfide reductase family protein [Aureibaculum sp. 2210JD6-5]